MANRRMLNKTVVESDPFFEMPADSQALYMHLVLNADDEGFVGNPETIRRMTGFSKDSLKLLIAKGFLISFQSGVVVVTHWEMQNKIQPSRKTKTIFTDEKGLLLVDEQGKYLIFNNSSEPCQQDADKMSEECQRVADKTSEQVSIGKDSIDKYSIDKDNISTTSNDAKAIVPINENQNKFNMEFEKLWEIYPNKKGKAKALTKYILSRKKGTTYEQVYDGINNYIEYIKKNKISSQYIKHGDTYFYNQCWLDEYKDTKVSKNNNDEQWDLLKGVYDGTIKVN